MPAQRTPIFLAIARVTATAAIAAALCIIAQRLILLANTTAGAVSSLAGAATVGRTTPKNPTKTEIARLRALSQRIDLITDNLANAQTLAFKRRRAELCGDAGDDNALIPLDMSEGNMESTGDPLDLAIAGPGFFHVQIQPGKTAYTRMGSLIQNHWGDLVVNVGLGYELIPPVNVPQGTSNISIAVDGTITFTKGSGGTSTAGQIHLAQFANAQGLAWEGGVLYTQTAASGEPIIGDPGQNGSGTLLEGFLEKSNVEPIKEWAELVKAEQQLQLSGQAFELVERERQIVAGLDRQ